MLETTVTITLPETVWHKLQKAAELTFRSVDEILASTVDATLVAPPNLPIEVAHELAAMEVLGDDALWAAVQPSISPAQQYRLQQLNHLGGERQLIAAETADQAELIAAHFRSVLRRAQALVILKKRGHQISPDSLSILAAHGHSLYSNSTA